MSSVGNKTNASTATSARDPNLDPDSKAPPPPPPPSAPGAPANFSLPPVGSGASKDIAATGIGPGGLFSQGASPPPPTAAPREVTPTADAEKPGSLSSGAWLSKAADAHTDAATDAAVAKAGYSKWESVNAGDDRAVIASGPGTTGVSFRSTQTAEQWASNFDVSKTAGGEHKGMADGVSKLEAAGLDQKIDQAHARAGTDETHYSGFSRGGGEALIKAKQDSESGKNVNSVTTQGSPAVFTPEAAQQYDAELGARTTRVVNGQDPVPNMSKPFGFVDVAQQNTVTLNGDGSESKGEPPRGTALTPANVVQHDLDQYIAKTP